MGIPRALAAAILCLSAPLAAQEYFVRTFAMADGLPFNQVLTVRQDARGYLWVGTTLGLTRLDGFMEPRNFGEQDGLPANPCTRVAEDKRGRLWVQTTAGVAFLEPGAASFTRVRETRGWNTALAVSGEHIYFSSEGDGLFRCRVEAPLQPVFWNRERGLPSARVLDLCLLDGDRAYLATGNGLFLARFTDQAVAVEQEFLPGTEVTQVRRIGNQYYAAAADGLWVVEGRSIRRVELPQEASGSGVRSILPVQGFWPEETLGVILRDGSRTFHIRRGDAWSSLGRATGLSSDLVSTAFQDREGILWIGTDQGLNILSGTDILQYRSEVLGVRNAFLYACAWVGRELWVGSRTGVRRIGADGTVLPPPKDPPGSADVWDLQPFEGAVFAAGTGRIWRLGKDGRAVAFDSAQGRPLGRIYDLDAFGSVLIAGGQNGLFLYEDGAFIPVPLESDLGNVYSCHLDSAGRIWLCTIGHGIRCVDRTGRTLGRWGPEQGLRGRTVYDMAETEERLWFGTSAGLVSLDGRGGALETLPEGHPLAGTAVPALAVHPQGTLWVGSMQGLYLFDPRTRKVLARLTGRSGLLGTDVSTSNGLLAAPDGGVWIISASSGINRLSPAGNPAFRARPSVEVPAVTAQGRIHSPALTGGQLELKWSESRDLSFSLALLSFRSPDSVRLMAYLHPFERDFTPVGGGRSLRYTSLSPGRYTFHLKAEVEGQESPVEQVFLHIAPPWWRTWIFDAAAVLAVAAAAFGLYRWRLAAFRRRQRELEALVETRTHDLMEEKDKLDKAYGLLHAEREKSEALLLNVLPAPIAERLKGGQNLIADHFDAVTVLFADIVDFTKLSARISPVILVGLLDEIFQAFDALAEKHGLEKIKTIGDAYMVVGGLPVPRPDHAGAVAAMALDMREALAGLTVARTFGLRVRIGIHTGPVVSGVIGKKKFIYDLWGDTVNTASRMESHGVPGEVQVSAATAELLRGAFVLEPRGAIQVKGKGEMEAFLVKGRASAAGG
jgi:class 3 adenylate cyclase/ligand-binding sensor domain-containing protein